MPAEEGGDHTVPMKPKALGIIIMLAVVALINSGCTNSQSILNPLDHANQPEPANLIQVEIHFTDNTTLTAYVKGLGINDTDDKVYSGGSTLNYYYDQEGNLLGGFNYQRVLYMQIIKEEAS